MSAAQIKLGEMTSDERPQFPVDDFVHKAMEHGFLRPAWVEQIRNHSLEHGVSSADAVRELALLDTWEIDAIKLLSRPKDFVDGYELIGLLGGGAVGTVFRAKQQALGREVAIKTIHGDGRDGHSKSAQRIQDEAQAIARLKHPNIVAAYDSGFSHGRFFITMEYVAGETLLDFIDRSGIVDERTAWRIARQAAAALSHASSAGILHRDVKPSNLLLTQTPEGIEAPIGTPFVKTVDFGLALDKLKQRDHRLTASGTALGTPAYVAPEQLEGGVDDCRADIYSLGATVFHMLSGKVPYAELSPMQAILKKTVRDDTWRDLLPERVSSQSKQLLIEMTEANFEHRIGSYDVLIRRIDELLHREANSTPASLDETSEFLVRRRLADSVSSDKKSRWLYRAAGLAVAGTILLVAAVWGLTHQRGKSIESKTSNPPLVLANNPNQEAQDQTWKNIGLRMPLFNGRSVPLRPLQNRGGNWGPGEAPDGTPVLTGGAGAKLWIPLQMPETNSDNVELRFRTLIGEQRHVEFRIAAEAGTGAEPSALLLMDNERASYSVDQEHHQKETISLPQPPQNEFLFRRLQIRRTGTRIACFVNGKEMGELTTPEGVSYGITLNCLDGSTIFADLDIVELVQQLDSN